MGGGDGGDGEESGGGGGGGAVGFVEEEAEHGRSCWELEDSQLRRWPVLIVQAFSRKRKRNGETMILDCSLFYFLCFIFLGFWRGG